MTPHFKREFTSSCFYSKLSYTKVMALGRELMRRSQRRDKKTSKGLLKVMKALDGGLGTQEEEEGQMLGTSENGRGERARK